MGKKKNSFFKKVIPVVLNKYFISIVAIIVWVTFFDKDDLLSQYQLRQKLQQLRTERNYYKNEIKTSKNDMNELRTNPANLEKFAREKYQMKKDNEEIFVIVKDTVKKSSVTANWVPICIERYKPFRKSKIYPAVMLSEVEASVY